MGIITKRAGWRRLQIAYQIRGELEHEDDE